MSYYSNTGPQLPLPANARVTPALRTQSLDDLDTIQFSLKKKLRTHLDMSAVTASQAEGALARARTEWEDASQQHRDASRELAVTMSQVEEYRIGLHKCQIDMKHGEKALLRCVINEPMARIFLSAVSAAREVFLNFRARPITFF